MAASRRRTCRSLSVQHWVTAMLRVLLQLLKLQCLRCSACERAGSQSDVCRSAHNSVDTSVLDASVPLRKLLCTCQLEVSQPFLAADITEHVPVCCSTGSWLHSTAST